MGCDAGARKLDWYLNVALSCVEGNGCLYIRVDQSLDASFPRGTRVCPGARQLLESQALVEEG